MTSDGGAVDSRVLGPPEFVEEILLWEGNLGRLGERRTIAEIMSGIVADNGIAVRAITGGSRLKAAVKARSAVCRVALEEGHSAAEVARQLGMSRYGVGIAGKREPVAATATNEESIG